VSREYSVKLGMVGVKNTH